MIEETDPVAIMVNSLTRDPLPGEVICRYHMIQRAVDPETGAPTEIVEMPAAWGQVVDRSGRVVEPEIIKAHSSIGVCEECWRESHSGAYASCPVHGVQLRKGGGCPVCDSQGLDAPLLVSGGQGRVLSSEVGPESLLEAAWDSHEPDQGPPPTWGAAPLQRSPDDGAHPPDRSGGTGGQHGQGSLPDRGSVEPDPQAPDRLAEPLPRVWWPGT